MPQSSLEGSSGSNATAAIVIAAVAVAVALCAREKWLVTRRPARETQERDSGASEAFAQPARRLREGSGTGSGRTPRWAAVLR